MTLNPGGVERLYLDFDSFFASAEQHFNSALRGRPVGVVPLDSPHTGCIAISREAKALGVKGNASIKDARRLVPEIVFVVARPDVYVRLHDRILDAIESCVPVAHVRSIDEVVCHLLPCGANERAILAQQIKATLRTQFSDVLTCSIGFAPTELLAKIAAEMEKPDGHVHLVMSDLPARLQDLPLQKLPGVSDGMMGRLNAADIHDFRALWDMAPKQARSIWGNVEGERFWYELHGIHAQRPATVKRMFSHSRMLPRDWRGTDELRSCARQLTMSAARRLRRARMRATTLTLSFRGGPRPMSNGRDPKLRWLQDVGCLPSRDDHTFLRLLSHALTQFQSDTPFSPRSVAVTLHGLTDEAVLSVDLFSGIAEAGGPSADDQKKVWEGLSDMTDDLRRRFGPSAISLGSDREVPGGYLGGKIAFGRIPDKADFGTAPVADGDTHFCSF